MMPTNISLIKYNHNKTGGYFGGYRKDTRSSYVCGFVDRLHALTLSQKILYENFSVNHDPKNNMLLYNIIPKSKLMKPIIKKKIDVVTMNNIEASFFLKVNNTNLVLINNIIEVDNGNTFVLKNDYTIEAKRHYLINPIYKYKFGWQPKEQVWLIKQIPFIRNFFTTCVYYIIRK